MEENRYKPLFVGRGTLLIDDFCRESGIDRGTAQSLLDAGHIEGLVGHLGRVVGLFDDALPTADQLRRLGLDVHDSYQAGSLRSHTTDDADEQEDDGPTRPFWKMEW